MVTISPPRRSILLVEDDVESAQALSELLMAQGYRVRAARTGDEALELLALAREPQLVLLDLALPDMSGVDFGRRLRGFNSRPPVVIMSALPSSRIEEAAREVNAAWTLRKPFPAAELLRCIDGALRSQASY